MATKKKKKVKVSPEQKRARVRDVALFIFAFIFGAPFWLRFQGVSDRLYAIFIFCIIFFGAIWIKTLIQRLHRYPANHNKFVVWFFAAAATAWWAGVQLNHYFFLLGFLDGDIERGYGTRLSHVDYGHWITYASLVGVLALGYVALKMIRSNQPISQRRDYIILGTAFFCMLLLGVWVNGTYRVLYTEQQRALRDCETRDIDDTCLPSAAFRQQ
jgi:hypothetical protein